MRYGRNLGFEQPFLSELFPTLEGQLAGVFPELRTQRETILQRYGGGGLLENAGSGYCPF